jgi:hypothetical protein
MCSDNSNISNIMREKYQVCPLWNNVWYPLVTM